MVEADTEEIARTAGKDLPSMSASSA